MARRFRAIYQPLASPTGVTEESISLRLRSTAGVPLPVIHNKVRAAAAWIERRTTVVLLNTIIDCWAPDPSVKSGWQDYGVIELPRSPLRAVSGVYTTDEAGVESTVPSSLYWVSGHTMPGCVSLRSATCWPAHREFEGLRIRASVGFATPFLATAASADLACPNHNIDPRYPVVLNTLMDSVLPTPLVTDTNYWVTVVDANTVRLAESEGGSPITITNAGKGPNFIGAMPEDLRRALVILAGLETLPDPQARATSYKKDTFNVFSLVDQFRVDYAD